MDLSTLQLQIQSKRPPPPSGSSSSRNINRLPSKCLIPSLSLLTLPFLFYLLSTAHKLHLSPKFAHSESTLFGVVVSARPASVRLRIFHFLDGTAPSSSTSSPHGLSAFAANPDHAGGSLVPLLRFAKLQVPKKERGNTKLLFFAGAELDALGPEVAEKLLESCRKVLRSSGFWFKDEWARVIPGEEQGVYAWVSANYALGTLQSEPQETTGIVELGGTSLQVTYAAKESLEVNSSPSRIIKLFGVTYHLYSQGLPLFGQDAAWESLYELQKSRELTTFSSSKERSLGNPCIPKGYKLTVNASDTQLLVSSMGGNFSACKSEALALLKRRQDKCMHAPCKIVSSFPFELRGKPVSTKNFLFTSEVCKQATLSEAGMELVELNVQDFRVGFANKTGNILLDWTLGAFLVETMLEPLEWELDNMGQIVGNDCGNPSEEQTSSLHLYDWFPKTSIFRYGNLSSLPIDGARNQSNLA
ncbi:putative apyrase 6 [Prunus yedoensis var. nudiflora]|uniref:Putative apyrase 6 n=1 Tax=Prunus yedoensis var. nudiflora TaxID=2094558 RepID=A0A314YZR2_PRUYE|nr:putative apyrase 6 [Prunus yedoensis var. nudiflora]